MGQGAPATKTRPAGVVERVFSYTDWNAVRGGSTVTS
jgi:hypothetical protein